MTNVSGEEFLNKLYTVAYKLYTIASTQSYRFKKEWDENLSSFKEKPHLVRYIKVEKEKFLIIKIEPQNKSNNIWNVDSKLLYYINGF